MRILSPIDRPEEVAPLAAAGADELYGGVIPDGWRFLSISPNQRTFAGAQFPSENAFAEAVAEARSRGLSFHLTLNAPLYPPERLDELVQLARRAAAWGVESVIVGDFSLLRRLSAEGGEVSRRVQKTQGPAVSSDSELKITLSTMAGTMNRHAVGFYKAFGVSRVVLPRHLTLGEMASLVAHAPQVAFEAFVLVGKCPNEEAFCTFQHIAEDKRWPCEIPYRLFRGETSEPLDAGHPLARREALWREADRRFGCGLCALDDLKRIGVEIVKLVGRGGPTAGKVENVRLVKRFLAEGGDAREAYRQRFGRACNPLVCYFPEARPR